MSNLGLYVDFWRSPGLHSAEEMIALNNYCVEKGITDVYIHYKKDKWTSRIMYFLEHSDPPFNYLNEVKTYLTPRLHLWLPILLLFRKKNAIAIDESLKTMEFNNQIYLDPVDEYTRDYIVNYINSFNFDRLHLDRLWYPMMSDIGMGTRDQKIEALTDIVRRVRQANPVKYISIAISTYELFSFQSTTFGLNDWRSWVRDQYIDKVTVNVLGAQGRAFDLYCEKAVEITDTISLYEDSIESIEKAKNNNMNIILFSYGTANILSE